MFAFAEMLVPAAKAAGIKLPEDVNNYNKNEFPHWFIYTALQLGAPMPYMSAHIDNAKIIAGIPEDKLKTMVLSDFEALGINIGYPTP